MLTLDLKCRDKLVMWSTTVKIAIFYGENISRGNTIQLSRLTFYMFLLEDSIRLWLESMVIISQLP